MKPTMIERLRKALYPFVKQNDVSDAMLYGPAQALGVLDATLEALLLEGRVMEPGTVTLTAATNTITQVAEQYGETLDWNLRFRVGDKMLVTGSVNNQAGEYIVASVAVDGESLTVEGDPFTVTETDMSYAKRSFALIRLCQDMLLYPGGYESDEELLSDVIQRWQTIHEQRGSRVGIKTEAARMANGTAQLLESVVNPVTLSASESYTQATQSISVSTGWDTLVGTGYPISIVGSTLGSDGRFEVYAIGASSIELGNQSYGSRSYPAEDPTGLELQFKEDREANRLWVRLVNPTGSDETVTFDVTVTGATIEGADFPASLTAVAGSSAESSILLSGTSEETEFQLVITVGSPTGVRLGEASLAVRTNGEALDLANIRPWKWGGIVRAGLASGVDEANLTIYSGTAPGWHLGINSPDSVEEECYAIAYPDTLAVLEVDHRNRTNYSEEVFRTIVREVLVPASVDVILGVQT